MSTTYLISRISRPTRKELKDIEYFSEYQREEILDEDGECTGVCLRLFRKDDPYVANLSSTHLAVHLTLPQIVTDYPRMYKDMGFSEESIKGDKIYIRFSDGYHYDFWDGKEKIRITRDFYKKYDMTVQTECFAIKVEELWDSSEVYCYPDRDRVDKYIPGLDKYCYVPVTNSVLAKAEIPFLIFDRNRGHIFLERC